MLHKSLKAGAIIAASLLTWTCLPTAYADGEQIVAEATASLIAEVSPDAGIIIQPDVVGNAIVAQTDGAEVIVPLDADVAVVVRTDDASLAVSPVEISLPEELSVKDARVADDGTILFMSQEKGGSDAAVQILDDGSVRIETVTRSPEGDHEFTYDFGDAILRLQGDGSVDVLQIVESDVARIEMGVGKIEPAWAVDASGDPVDTWYEVSDDGAVIQIIAPKEDSIYPIVADPLYSHNSWGGVIYFNRSETAKFALGATGVNAVAQFMPAPYGALVRAMAILITGASAYTYAIGGCIDIQFLGSFIPWSQGTYYGGYCK